MSDEKYLCPNCGDDRTGKGSLIDTGTPSKAFCNEFCVKEWRQKRIAELLRAAIATVYDDRAVLIKATWSEVEAAIDAGEGE